MSIQRYTIVMRHAVMLRPPNVLPAESSTTETNSSHLLREARGGLSRRRDNVSFWFDGLRDSEG